MGVQTGVLQQPVHHGRRGGGEGDGGIGGHDHPGGGDSHGIQLLFGVGVPQGDGVHAALEHPVQQLPVGGIVHRADAAAVHVDRVAQLLGHGDGEEVEPQAPAAGHVLHQGAAAVDIQAGLAHPAQKAEEVEGVDGVDPVLQAGLPGLAGEDPYRQVGVDGAHLPDDGLQDGVVPGVAPAIGAADEHAVPAGGEILFPGLLAQDGLVDVQLAAQGALQGELALRLGVQPFPQMLAQGGVGGQGRELAGQALVVPGLEQEAGYPVLNEVGDAAHPAGHGGQTGPGSLGDGVGEGLGQGGEGVDVQGVIKGIGVLNPAAEVVHVSGEKLGGESPQLLPLPALAGDEQTEILVGLIGFGKAPDQGAHVLHGIQTGGDAHHHAGFIEGEAAGAQVVLPAHGGGAGGEIQTVVDGEELVRVEAPGDEQVGHGVGHADAVIQKAQGDGVDGAVGQPGEGAAQVVQPVVGVDRGDHGQAGASSQHGPHQIAPGTVAVDEVVVLGVDQPGQGLEGAQDILSGQDHGADAQLPGLLGEGPLHEADHGHVDGPGQVLKQRVDVGLGAPRIAAGNQMDDFHHMPPKNRLV